MSMLAYVLPFAAAWLTSLALLRTVRWHGRISMDSGFGVQKHHTAPTTRIGGIAIAAGLLMAWLVVPEDSRAIVGPMAIAGIPAFAAGLMEDLTKNVSVRTRLLSTMASGVMAWLLTDIAMQDTGLWGLDHLLSFLPLAVMFTAFVVSGVANAINIVDGFNGLAAGVSVIALSAMGLMALQHDDVALATAAFAMVAIAVGFCAVNWPLGRIFMGDGGAYLLGFVIAWIAILLPMRHAGINGWATLLACAYPVLEVLFSIRRRIKRHGHHPGQPDRCHLHHFVNRRVVRKLFPGVRRDMQNGLTGSMVWILAAPPAIWAVAFNQNTWMLVLGFGVATFVYSAIYARLTQFVWCVQASTLKTQPVSAT